MRRLLMVSAVAALMAAMMVVISAPAMARDFDFNGDHDDDNDDVNRIVFFGDDRFNDRDRFDIFGNDGLDQESRSGDVENNFRVSNTGDYASQCTPAMQFGNTGNFNNGSSFVQYASPDGADDFEPGGIEFAFEPEQETACENTIQQSSAASGS